MRYVNFLADVEKAKHLPRTGWVREKVQDPESVADHSFLTIMFVMTIVDKLDLQLDKEKLLKMVILQGLGEVVTGDVVVNRWDIIDIKKRDEKERQERIGIKKMFDVIGLSEEYVRVFDEMVARVTPEAKVFWQLDNLEMAMQALEYENEQGKNLEEFFMTTELYVKEPLLKKIFDDILKRRKVEKKL